MITFVVVSTHETRQPYICGYFPSGMCITTYQRGEVDRMGLANQPNIINLDLTGIDNHATMKYLSGDLCKLEQHRSELMPICCLFYHSK